jgi:hypothetical protein
MKPLQITLATIAFLALITQTVRHAYMLWLEPRSSVLDKYDQPVKGQINEATTLDELVSRYEAAHKLAEAVRKEHPEADREPYNLSEDQRKVLSSESMLRDAIGEWEKRSKEIGEIRFFCAMGLIFTLAGLLFYGKVNPWFGLLLLIAGFSEFIYWTSPTFLGSTHEYDRLLANKLTLSGLGLLLLLGVFRILRIFPDERGRLQGG